MDKLAALNLAVTGETSVNPQPEITPSYSLFFPELDRKKPLSGAWIPFLFFTIALFIISLASPVLALRKGERGSDVTALQKTLQENGYFNGPVTGYYGPLTEAAVKKFQQSKGLNADGIVGSKTKTVLQSGSSIPSRESINNDPKPTLDSNSSTPTSSQFTPPTTAVNNEPLASPKPTFLLKRGDRNSQVTSLQKNLQLSGYFNGPITGYYGSATQEAVMKLQKARGLNPDGIAGPKTRAAIESSPATPIPTPLTPPSPMVTDDRLGLGNPSLVLKRGTRNADVTALQKKLQSQGYFDGPITGYYGSLTEAAVIKFQEANGLIADGIVDSKTQTALEFRPIKPTPSPVETPDSVFNEDSFINEENKEDNSEEKPPSPATEMTLKKTISGKISPKSIVHSGTGLFFAQNMMYSHSITVYNRDYNLVKTLSDTVNLSKYGHTKFKGTYKGAPVEAAFSDNGQYAWISNYQMYGPGFNNPGDDKCDPSQKKDNSFLYRVNTETMDIEEAIQVGSVPKFVATSPDNQLVLVSNWCSWDLSVVDAQENKEIRRIKLGRYPRGIVVDSDSEKAYVAVMGSYDIATVNLNNFSVEWLKNIGEAPRHLNLDPSGQYLYSTLNGEDRVAKIDLSTGKVLKRVFTGQAPRSMVISDDGERLYVVNYNSNTVSKVRTSDMKVLQTVNVNANPIGITYDPQTRQVWVACYSGSIMVFQD
ncbi:MAG TPA: peptidoglycan-binding protein [Cyanobacteria bacterium UBA11370]|nr:peptidoglycan-binding protein [Cyanobacteria bacterium UBA11370]